MRGKRDGCGNEGGREALAEIFLQKNTGRDTEKINSMRESDECVCVLCVVEWSEHGVFDSGKMSNEVKYTTKMR